MHKALLAFTAIALVTTTGCAMSVRESFAKYAADRAAFDLDCPKERLDLVPLNVPLDTSATPGAQVGVKGCGRRAVYVAAMGAGWVLNGGSDSAEAPAAKP